MATTTNKTEKMTDEKLKELKTKADEILTATRQNILMRYPFTGAVAMKLDMIPVRDYRVRTAQTDGSRIYFDMDFLSKLDSQERVFVLSHEIFHCVMLSMLRLQNRNPKMWNYATDMEINNLLVKDNIKIPEGCLLPPHNMEGDSAEEIYEYLLKQLKQDAKSQQQKKQKSQKGNQKSQGGSGSDSDDTQDEESSEQQNGSSGSGKKNGKNQNSQDDDNDPKDGKNTGKLTGQFDKHTYGNHNEDSKDDDDDQNGNNSGKNGKSGNQNGQSGNGSGDVESQYGVSDQWGDVGKDPDYNPQISGDLGDKMRETVISAAQQTERTRGELPAHLKRIVNKISEPEIKWQEVLAQFITRSIKSGKRTWTRPSRRHVCDDIYLPSRSEERINVAIGIDTSGSTSEDLPKFFAELKSLVSQFSYNMQVVQCDAEVGSYEEYDSNDNPFEYNIKDYKFTGNGGTYLHPIFDSLRKRGANPDCLIMFTDGYTEEFKPKDAPGYPVLWVLTADGAENCLGFGQKVHFKHSPREHRNW